MQGKDWGVCLLPERLRVASAGALRSCPLSRPHAADSPEQECGRFGSTFLKIVQVLPPAPPHPSSSDHTLVLAPDCFPYRFWGAVSCPVWPRICLCGSPGRGCASCRLISDRRRRSPSRGCPTGLGCLLPSPDGGVGPGFPHLTGMCVEACCLPGTVPGLRLEQ